ncbi:hypothetical protein PV08_05918 [Exophiala spinifera]|uniref:Transcription factor domain-containing protein n=1 Tax=Exophiala spinifera TaxID=91928 RepID=A0A0D2BA47_9EURO|nr:uncharacterized protein PV08_05918 [Exophiala spinifera]KIW15868.1 hypothetical protein PV08_05918 [Exophiala spinifera]
MTSPAIRERNFINITGEPNAGRHARRIHVRRTVMKNYHRQRRQKKKLPSKQGPAASSLGSEQATQSSSPYSSNLSLLDGRSPNEVVLDPAASSLFRAKAHDNPIHAQISTSIIRFLCGLVVKARQSICHVGFIHHAALEAESPSNHFLATCRDILSSHHDSTAPSPSSPALWERVHVAQEDIYVTCAQMNNWQLLSAAQAITLYILARFRNGKDDRFPHMDIALLFTLRKVFSHLKADYLSDGYHNRKCGPPAIPTSSWRDWIFHESVSRTATVYFLLTVVVSMDFGIECDQADRWRVEDMLLPGAKASWEARDEVAWRSSTSVSGNVDRLPFTLRLGDLASVDSSSGLQAQIAAWQEELDEFGMVITLAGQMLMD